MKKISLACLAFFVLSCNAHATTTTVVTSLADFTAAVAGTTITTETFDNEIASAVSITFDTGVTSTLAGGDLVDAINFGDNRVDSGVYRGGVDGGGAVAALTTTFDFTTPIVGFGGDFGAISRLDVSIDGGTTFFDLFTETGEVNGFFGLVSTTAFSSVQFSTQNSTSFEGFRIDNLVFAAPVPVPAAVWLMGSALMGLVGVARRRS